MSAVGLDGGVGRFTSRRRRPKCADACVPITTFSVTASGARVRRARCPLSLCAKPTKRPRSQQAMGAVRRCLRTRADRLGDREADSGHGVCFTAEPLREADETAPEPRGRLS